MKLIKKLHLFTATMLSIFFIGIVSCPEPTSTPPSNSAPIPGKKNNILTISASKVSIDDYEFKGDGYTGIVFEEGSKLKTIGKGAFKDNKLTALKLPETVTDIADEAFKNNDIKTLYLGTQVKTIGIGSFESNEIVDLVIPDQVTSIGTNAFKDNAVEKLTIGSKLTTIGRGAFETTSTSLKVEIKKPLSLTTASKIAGVFGKGVTDNFKIVVHEDKTDEKSVSDFINNIQNEIIKIQALLTVSFDSTGGTKISQMYVEKNNKISRPQRPTKESHVFLGWYTDNRFSTKAFDNDGNSVSITSDTTFYTKWKEGYTVNFDSKGGSKISQVHVDKNSKVTKPEEPRKEGHTFGGWYIDSAFTTKAFGDDNKSIHAITQNTTFYAKWIIKQYEVTFYKNNVQEKTIKVDHGSVIKVSDIPSTTKASHEFIGWFTAAHDGISVNLNRHKIKNKSEFHAKFMLRGRYYHEAVVFKNKLWLIGGEYGSGKYYNDVLSSTDGITWEVHTNATKFPARSEHKIIVFKNKLWLIGGFRFGIRSDIWSSDDGITWKLEKERAEFGPRKGQQLVIFQNKLWLIGGMDGDIHRYNIDVWNSDDGITWTHVRSISNDASQLEKHQVVVFQNKLWMFGYYWTKNWKLRHRIWYSDNGTYWRRISHTPSFTPVQNSQILVFNNKLLVIGGKNASSENWESNYSNEVWELTINDFNQITSRKISQKTFTPRGSHQVEVFKNKLWLTGGWGPSNTTGNEVWNSTDGIDWGKIHPEQ